jgi:hypothetical protein
MNYGKLTQLSVLCFLVVSCVAESAEHVSQFVGSVYDVKNFGANGTKQQDSRETTQAIQKAIDTCAEAGGGTVYVGPGDYVTGRLNLRSHVHFYIEAGATIYGSRDRGDWKGRRRAILYGEDLTNISIGGYGTVDGRGEQAKFPYMEKRDGEIQDRIDALKRDKPDGMPFWKWTPPIYNIVYLRHCRDVMMTGVKLINSPIWCVHFLGCERVVVDGVYVYSSLVRGVNSDGINPNSCKDVRIANCTIVTGDDCISIKSNGPRNRQAVCENITITNCRLTSASAAVKIGDEISADVRHVLINNCVIRNSHRAFAMMILDGGTVSDVIISNVTIECARHDWFWWGQGDAFYFKIAKRNEQSAIGQFKNILIKDVIAHVKGSSIINGHQENPLTGIRFENVKLIMSEDPKAYFREAKHAIQGRYLKDLTLKDVSVAWQEPVSEKWRSALYLEDVDGLTLDGFKGKQGLNASHVPAIVIKNVTQARLLNCVAPVGTHEFLHLEGENNEGISFFNNDFSAAQHSYGPKKLVDRVVVHSIGNHMPE